MTSFDAKKDFTSELETIIPESIAVANDKGIDEAVVLLFALEKKCRLSNDTKNLKEVCLHTIRLCKDKNDWIKLNSCLVVINKRDSQIKVVISAVVGEAISYIEGTPTLEVKIELIKALKDICDGKIYVEGESARLHFMLSKIYEDKGDIDAACEVIQDVHVETYGSLTKQEKANYILEQMRLNLIKKDYIRMLIHSRKMNRNTLEENGFSEIKIRFFKMMVEYYIVDKNAWEVCQSLYKIAATSPLSEASNSTSAGDGGSGATAMETAEEDPSTAPTVAAEATTDPAALQQQKSALESCIVFLLMSKFDNHQSDMMHRVKQQLTETLFKTVSLDAVYLGALTLFTTHEIIPTPFPGQELFMKHEIFVPGDHMSVDIGSHFQKQLADRVIEHNLRVIARYYKRIRSDRLSALLGLDYLVLETHLSEIASAGDLYVKIDRPAGIINFNERQAPDDILTEWSSDVGKMLQLIEATSHLINRENMVHKV
eukprot:CAMPEP_0174974060 /NCGR_PEP_ID=MMETSP0004_2-20121128/11613_1 /TAXON_ID=420556 /ORGANISM="Ochromonas sp., Strain CCMP1393" /LENGTH=485 /DNA_ID=CAMNT_0016224629 /DNA_START=60 /DNA_END=1517 /DNA_ORIENTATION=+